MAKKLNITFRDDCEQLWEALDIPTERAEQLEYRLNLITHEMHKPLRKGEPEPTSGMYIKLCVALAETEQELVFCSYIAGLHVPQIWNIYSERDHDG